MRLGQAHLAIGRPIMTYPNQRPPRVTNITALHLADVKSLSRLYCKIKDTKFKTYIALAQTQKMVRTSSYPLAIAILLRPR